MSVLRMSTGRSFQIVGPCRNTKTATSWLFCVTDLMNINHLYTVRIALTNSRACGVYCDGQVNYTCHDVHNCRVSSASSALTATHAIHRTAGRLRHVSAVSVTTTTRPTATQRAATVRVLTTPQDRSVNSVCRASTVTPWSVDQVRLYDTFLDCTIHVSLVYTAVPVCVPDDFHFYSWTH